MVRINRDNLFLHIPDDKLITIKKVVDKIEVILNKHEILSTDFLNPYEIELAKSILNKFDINYSVEGGYPHAERNIIYMYPEYLSDIEKYKINYLSIKKKEDIDHRDVLGSILRLGIDRNKVGDIIINDNNIFVFVKAEQFSFLRFNLNKIGRQNVDFTNDEFSYEDMEYIEKKYIVSSLRLDTVLSSVLKMSRSKTDILIKSGRVQVNFKIESKNSLQLNEGDILSVRGSGRMIFQSIENVTKKENFVINMKFPKWGKNGSNFICDVTYSYRSIE